MPRFGAAEKYIVSFAYLLYVLFLGRETITYHLTGMDLHEGIAMGLMKVPSRLVDI